jgi:hypothetical protein
MAKAIGNRISFTITDAQMQKVLSSRQVLQETLAPLLVSLGTQSRRTLPKLGPKGLDFMSKTFAYAENNAQFQPTFVDMGEFATDLAAVGLLRQIVQPLSQLVDMLNDTLLLSSAGAYSASLACYKAFKAADEADAPGANSIVNELSPYFAQHGKKSSGKTPPPADASSQP